MLVSAEELVTPGGPSAPVWIFLTTIIVAIISVLAQQLKAKSDLKAARSEVSKASESAKAAQKNTSNIANGFAGRMDTKLDDIAGGQARIQGSLLDLDKTLRDHLAWHLEKEK